MHTRFNLSIAAICGSAMCSGIASAQTPINAPGAMQPSTGTGVWHVMPMYREIGSDPTSTVSEGEEFILLSQIAYGVNSKFSLQLDVPLVYRDVNSGPFAGSVDDDELGV